MDIVLIISLSIFIFLIFAAGKFLLRDQGCTDVFNCKEEKSAHLSGTFLYENDTCETAIDKLKTVLRVNSKTGVWKMCLCATIAIVFLMIVCKNSTKNNSKYYFYILCSISTFLILYLVRNFENFHKYKPNSDNGDKIIDFINKNCINKFKNSTPVQN
jgi:hypothetical protein